MQEHQELLLAYLRGALWGRDVPPPPAQAEAGPLLTLATEQNILPLVLDRLVPEARHTGWPADALNRLRRIALQSAVGQTARTAQLEVLCAALAKQDLQVLVVKGLACRLLYPNPDLRPSSDEDLLVRERDVDRVHRVFLAQGLHPMEPFDRKDQVLSYTHPTSGLHVELHRRLFPQNAQAYGAMNRCFARAFQRAVPLAGAEGPVWTMGPRDHLLYLICHSFKHFLHSGFGIRQVCDLCLAAEAWGGEVDWAELFAALEPFRAACFAGSLFDIGRRALGFSHYPAGLEAALEALDLPDCTPLLEDLLSAGVFGGSSEERRHSSLITLSAVAAGEEEPMGRSLLHTVFPPARNLQHAYPYLKDRPWLLPAAWAQRIVHYAAGRHDRAASARESVLIGQHRVELLRTYRVIS